MRVVRHSCWPTWQCAARGRAAMTWRASSGLIGRTRSRAAICATCSARPWPQPCLQPSSPPITPCACRPVVPNADCLRITAKGSCLRLNRDERLRAQRLPCRCRAMDSAIVLKPVMRCPRAARPARAAPWRRGCETHPCPRSRSLENPARGPSWQTTGARRHSGRDPMQHPGESSGPGAIQTLPAAPSD